MDKKIQSQIEELIRALKKIRDKIVQLEQDDKFIKNRLIMLLDKAGIKSYEYLGAEFADTKLTCTVCERSDIKYDLQRARELLGPRECKKFVDKTYGVADISKLIDLAKAHGISPDELKSCLSITEKVNNKKLDQLYNVGEINAEDVQEFCTVEKTNRYIMLK